MNWICKFISFIIVIISIYNQNVCGTSLPNCYQQTEGDSGKCQIILYRSGIELNITASILSSSMNIFCYHLEIYEKLVSNCSVLCDSGTKAVQKLKCLKDDNGTSCAHVGFDLRKCFVDDESCPGKSTSILYEIFTTANV